MIKNFDDYLEMRLTQWAEWFGRDNQYLSYTSCSIEHRLMTEGIIVRSTAPKKIPCNEDAEEIESLVNEMAKYENLMAIALREKYFGKSSTPQRACKIGVSYTKFKIYVAMARQWLIGRLSASKFSKFN